MKLLYILYTYNRPKVLNKCWETLFDNNVLRPDKVIVLDDGSDLRIKQSLLESQNKNGFAFDFYSAFPNMGYGKIAERGIKLAEIENPDYVFFIETDYIFSKNGLDKVMDVFENNEFGKEAIWIQGYDHPDNISEEKTDSIFPRIIVEDCSEDNINRNILYKPFKQNTTFGEVEMEFVSNSCGTIYFNWKKFREISKEFPDEYNLWLNKTIDKDKNQRCLNDGALSHLSSWIWNKWAIKHGINRNKFAAALNIKPSVANHICGGRDSINGKIMEEGQTFVGSPTWHE